MRYLIAALIILLYALFCYGSWYRFARKNAYGINQGNPAPCIIGFASQTGFAQALATQTAQQLADAGIASSILPLNKITAEQLRFCEKLIVIASTYGEGEAPDNGARFIRQLPDDLHALHFAVLALGDREYTHFCAFGHAVDHALRERGAHSLFDFIEVDKQDAASLHHYQYCLGQLFGQSFFTDWQPVQYQSWQLHDRRIVNPLSLGMPVHWLSLKPQDFSIIADTWQAGDIADIGPCNSPARIAQFLQAVGRDDERSVFDLLARKQLNLSDEKLAALKNLSVDEIVEQLNDLPHREYSIASIPAQGALELLVRQVGSDEHDFGLGSGWLTQHSQLGSEIALKIRSNPSFHAPDVNVPMILIGNGTGMAGLRALLQQRFSQAARRNWLLFGERSAQADFYFEQELKEALAAGDLEKLDCVFSRDQKTVNAPRYVQDLLRIHADSIRQWVEDGAAIYVCGSLQGMAQGVDDALRDILGEASLQQLADQARYCRDVY